MEKNFKPKPNSLWLVVYECRYNVIMVSPLGDGFFAPGQEPCWHFRDVQDWVKEIKQPAKARPKSERVTYDGETKPFPLERRCKAYSVGKTCPKQPGNSLPIPKDAILCKGCDKTGKDQKTNKPKYCRGSIPSSH